MTRTRRTSHQMAPVLTRELSTTWLWFGVGTKIGAVGDPLGPANNTDKSTEDACIVHVPGTALFGSGHCVVMAGFTFVFHASGTRPNMWMSACPNGPAQFPRSATIRTGHRISRIGVVID